MAGTHARLRPVLGLVAALAFLLAPAAQPATAAQAQAWDGSFDLYGSGTFTTQKTWLWCTAADVQIMRNIAEGQRDHAKSSQQRYFDWMRSRNRYDLPVSAGVDPAGWTAGLRHFVDDRYRLVSSASFDGALRSAVQRMRATSLPVAIAVQHGNHGWVLTGFSATADPATTTDFTVTSVRVVGPLWGLQSRSYGYDMRPNRSLATRQLRGFFTPWYYAPTRMIWDGRYVSIQPVPQPTPQIAEAPARVLPSAAAPAASWAPAASGAPASSAASSIVPSAAPSSEPSRVASVPPSRSAATKIANEPGVPVETTPVADALGTPLGALIVIAVLGAAAILGVGIARRRPPHPVR